MKTLIELTVYFIFSWGLGLIVCGLLIWRGKKQATIIAALVLFGGPVFYFAYLGILETSKSHQFEAAKQEVKELCAKEGGDKIYKTAENVEGVFQMRARANAITRKPGGLTDQYGMFDPYGWAQGDRPDISFLLAGSRVSLAPGSPPYGRYGYWFVEQNLENDSRDEFFYSRTFLINSGSKHQFGYYAVQPGDPIFKQSTIKVKTLKSHFGYITEDITTDEMREKWIGAGRIKIIDLKTNEVLAVRTGFFRAIGPFLPENGDRWSGGGYLMCPLPQSNGGLIGFLHSVLRPVQGFPTDKQLQALIGE